MSNRNAPWTIRVFELLADGPKPLEFLIAETRNMVPPGRAYRQAERKRNQNAERRQKKTDRVQTVVVAEDDTIRTGQRQIVMMSISKLVMNGRLEYVEHEAGRLVRLGRDHDPHWANSPFLAKLHEHMPSYSKRDLGITNATNHPILAVDITCSCGWTWEGAERDEDGVWKVYATTKDEAEKAFTKHRRGSLQEDQAPG